MRPSSNLNDRLLTGLGVAYTTCGLLFLVLRFGWRRAR